MGGRLSRELNGGYTGKRTDGYGYTLTFHKGILAIPFCLYTLMDCIYKLSKVLNECYIFSNLRLISKMN